MKIEKNSIPTSSGVYLMKDINDKIIYIGKAKNLKNRVNSYFVGMHNTKTTSLVRNIEKIEYFLCNNEIEAYILENNLIKKYKPKYNILLKDQKTYPYIKIKNSILPSISIERKIENDTARYYGPYPNINKKKLHSILVKSFNIFECSYKNLDKVYSRTCMNYQIKRCNGICVKKDKETIDSYKNSYDSLIKFLENKDKSIIKKVEDNFKTYIKNMEFERAILEKEKLEVLSRIAQNQIIESFDKILQDVIYVENFSNSLNICILHIINGKILDKKTYKFNGLDIDEIIYMFYENNNIPDRIILNIDLGDKKIETLKDWFLKEKNKRIKIIIPKKKCKNYELLELAKKNLKINK